MCGKDIGFIGLGVMGSSMASHLYSAGYKMHLNTRTKDKALELIKKGCLWYDRIDDLVQNCDVVITMVGFPNEVRSLYLGDNGIVCSAKNVRCVVDMSTSSPDLAVEIYDMAKQRGVMALDAPVSGGDKGARDASLSIMVGGDKEAFDYVKPLFDVMGKNVVYQGRAGNGQHTKMANQIAIAAGMIAASESLAYAKSAGLDIERVLKSIENGAAGSWTLSNLVPRMIKKDYAPGFYVKHFVKDMGIAIDSCDKMKLFTPGLKLAKSLYDRLSEEGSADCGTQAIYKLFGSKDE